MERSWGVTEVKSEVLVYRTGAGGARRGRENDGERPWTGRRSRKLCTPEYDYEVRAEYTVLSMI